MNKILSKIKIYICLLIIVFCSRQSSFGSNDLCIAEKLRVTEVSGIVEYVNQSRLGKIAVILSRDPDTKSAAAQTETDESGQFALLNVSRGKYYLAFRGKDLTSLTIPIRVVRKAAGKPAARLKIVMSGLWSDQCSGAEAVKTIL